MSDGIKAALTFLAIAFVNDVDKISINAREIECVSVYVTVEITP